VGLYGETHPTSDGANQALSVKAEEASDADEELDPVQIAVQEVKAEPEVSGMFLYVHCYVDLTNMQKCQLSFSSPSVYPLILSIS
jgi:hypothetical protein